MTTLLVWAQCAHDTRYTASAVQTYFIRRGTPAAIARDIDRRGHIATTALVAAGNIAPNHVAPDTLAASGHGVIVKYANGHTRIVRA